MILSSPGSVLFDVDFVKIYYYGVIMAVSVLVGLLACKIICKKLYEKSDWEVTYNLALGTIISGFLGARIYYVVAAYNYYSKHIGEIFALQHGGMSIHGAILGGIIFAYLYLRHKKLPILKYLDIMTFGLITGQIIGRWGNFFNSEAFGLPTFSFFKLYISPENRPQEFMAFDYFHPTFLYESMLNIILLIILIFVIKTTRHSEGNLLPEESKTETNMSLREGVNCDPVAIQNIKIIGQVCPTYNKNDGRVFFTYILFYSIIRLFVEQIRLDSVLNVGGIPLAQIVSGIGIIIGFVGLVICLKRKV